MDITRILALLLLSSSGGSIHKQESATGVAPHVLRSSHLSVPAVLTVAAWLQTKAFVSHASHPPCSAHPTPTRVVHFRG